MVAALTVLVVCSVAMPVLTDSTVAAMNEPSKHDDGGTDQLIVGGQEVMQGEYPFVVALLKIDGEQFCGGTIIDRNVILTACHCVVVSFYPLVVIEPGDIRILAGAVNISNESAGLRYDSKRIAAHPKCWTRKTVNLFDVAVIEIQGYVTPKPQAIEVKQVPIYEGAKLINNLIENKVTCVTMGWGWESRRGSESTTLKKLSVILQTRTRCAELISKITSKNCISHQLYPKSEVCGLSVEGSAKTACYGDSGMPLVCGERKQLVGVLTGAPGDDPCGLKSIPTLFLRLDSAESWIARQMDDWTPLSNVNNLAPRLIVIASLVAYSTVKYLNYS